MVLNNEAVDYLATSNKYWQQALKQFEGREIEKAAELAWGSVAERIKALSLVRGGTNLPGHDQIRNYIKLISNQLHDEELYQLFLIAQRLHVEFYESHLDADDVRRDLTSVQKLLSKIDSLLYK
jgi:hypothetical protein